MYKHHLESIQRVTDYFLSIQETQALILGGSLAHGFAGETSDVDIMIIVSEEDHEKRLREENIQFFNKELCTYDAGYVDGKYLSMCFLKKVAEAGSEPARYAFSGSQVLFSRIDEIAAVIQQITQYPTDQKVRRIQRFGAQFEAWSWYAHEALRLNNRYLLGVATHKLVLFGGRLILAHNERLYPYHKWFLKVLEMAQDKPADLMLRITELCQDANEMTVRAFYDCVRCFRSWETAETGWPNQFVVDSELNWMNGTTPIDDI